MFNPISFSCKGANEELIGLNEDLLTYMISIVPLTIFFTWVFNNNNRSTLAAILLHITANTTAEIFSVTEQAYTYSIAISCTAAAAIVVIWGARTLRHQDDVAQPLNPKKLAE